MKNKKIIIVLAVAAALFMVTPTMAFSFPQKTSNPSPEEDLDPLVNIEVTVTIKAIRSLEKVDQQIPSVTKINWLGNPNFYVKVFINDVEFKSPVWKNTKYVYNPNWSVTLDVPDDQEWVGVRIELWDRSIVGNKQCDLSGITEFNQQQIKEDRGVNLSYNLKTGHWIGDDNINNMEFLKDPSGYGRLNGCDDGSIYQQDRDCELWFDINQTDPDGDGIPYWSEVNIYHTDPTVNDTGRDMDGDGCPIEWEHKWGYVLAFDYENETIGHGWLFTDLVWDDHKHLDFDNDGLTNYEEYLTSQWESDPYRKDIFVELDQMAPSPDGFKSQLPQGAKELIYTAFDRRNIVFHLDDGSMGGSETIPFQADVNRSSLQDIYFNYFLHGNVSTWRRGVFHYGVVVYEADYPGYTYRSDAFQISAFPLENNKTIPKLERKRDIVFGSAYMHECGHTLGFDPIGGHDDMSKYPWQLGWWKWRPYKSIMNYGYMYQMVDYSDGSRGKNDFNDWSRMDLTYFNGQEWDVD